MGRGVWGKGGVYKNGEGCIYGKCWRGVYRKWEEDWSGILGKRKRESLYNKYLTFRLNKLLLVKGKERI